jgi:dihydroxyacetone kinase-like protein
MLTLEELRKMLLAAAVELKEKSSYFCQLDSVAGDGDHGLTIGRMADAIKQKVELNDARDIKGLLDDVGMLCMGINGGSAGPLWGTVFSGLAAGAPADKKEVSPEEFQQMLTQAQSDFKDISKAKLGDKTMVDALYPALDAAIAAQGNLQAKMDAAAKAAVDGAAKTKDYIAKFGRAKNVGKASLGHEDPGAVSMSVLFAAMAKALH